MNFMRNNRYSGYAYSFHLLFSMRVQKLDFSETRSFSSFFLDYIQQTDSLKSFYHGFLFLKILKVR
jgi:hypothetical protein